MAGSTHLPAGFHSVTPYLIVEDAAPALDFYVAAFGATDVSKHTDPEGRIRHAEIKIGDSILMLTGEALDEWPDWQSPRSRGGTPLHLYLYVEDADSMFTRAIAAGAEEILPLEDHPYGDRSGGLRDPFGHVWYVATRIRD